MPYWCSMGRLLLVVTTCKFYRLPYKSCMIKNAYFFPEYFCGNSVFQSGRVTRLNCPCRNDLHTRGFKPTTDMEACSNFSIFILVARRFLSTNFIFLL